MEIYCYFIVRVVVLRGWDPLDKNIHRNSIMKHIREDSNHICGSAETPVCAGSQTGSASYVTQIVELHSNMLTVLEESSSNFRSR